MRGAAVGPGRGLRSLSALLLASQVAYDVIRIVGAAVLVWIGARALWQARRAGQPDQGPAETAAVSLRRAYGQGLVANFANPKASVFEGDLCAGRVWARRQGPCPVVQVARAVLLGLCGCGGEECGRQRDAECGDGGSYGNRHRNPP
ncbi:LysE family translocator [Streptomyces sp. NPDC058307]|uniref:LysE family translocator n=1 Tax=Streptomyces sp. NPDC058307 TaxID=3346439 RepID=UPI0036DFDED6